MVTDVLEWLSATPFAGSLRRSATLYMLANAAHILSIGLLIGAILPLDLRILGFFRTFPLQVLGPFLSRAAAIGAAGALATGFLLFSVRPVEYAGNGAFLAKISLVCLGLLNALALHLQPAWHVAASGGLVKPAVRLAAAVSLAIWMGALVAGRWIGFL